MSPFYSEISKQFIKKEACQISKFNFKNTFFFLDKYTAGVNVHHPALKRDSEGSQLCGHRFSTVH